MLSSGLALCLFGLLDLGEWYVTVVFDYATKTGGTNEGHAPITKLLYEDMPLVVVTLVYVPTWYGTFITADCVQRCNGGVFANPNDVRWISSWSRTKYAG